MKKHFAEYEKHMNREFRHNESGQNTTIRKYSDANLRN